MKKSITLVFAALLLIIARGAGAQQSVPAIAAGAPDSHVVVRGDTLWGIAARFLDQPWRWPELWRMNQEQIRDPHLIHPGDVVYLDRSGDAPRLRLGRRIDARATEQAPAREAADAAGIERLQPRVREEALAAAPIPTVDPRAIAPFLDRALVLDDRGLSDNPRIVATQDDRVYLSRGDLAFVRGSAGDAPTQWDIYREARALRDPDTRKPIAWEALFVGRARLERAGDPATMRIIEAGGEIAVGDRLLPSTAVPTPRLAPQAPGHALRGRIVAIHGGLAQAGRNSVVAIDRGATHGLAVGHALGIVERGRIVRDRERGDALRLPGQTIGHLLVFRVFDTIAYGLIMRSTRDISVGDDIETP